MTSPAIENSAKAVIISGGAVLLVRYEDTSDMGLGTWYSLPGGRQRYGETLWEALVRECAEELGAVMAVGPLLFVREYVHAHHELAGTGRDQHKVELMFRCSLESPLREAPQSDPDQETTEWVSLDKVTGITIFPTTLRDLGSLLQQAGEDPYWGDVY